MVGYTIHTKKKLDLGFDLTLGATIPQIVRVIRYFPINASYFS